MEGAARCCVSIATGRSEIGLTNPRHAGIIRSDITGMKFSLGLAKTAVKLMTSVMFFAEVIGFFV